MRKLPPQALFEKSTERESSVSEMLDYLDILVRKADGNPTKTARASVQRAFDKIVERLG